jgi:hypothetical protein
VPFFFLTRSRKGFQEAFHFIPHHDNFSFSFRLSSASNGRAPGSMHASYPHFRAAGALQRGRLKKISHCGRIVSFTFV